MKNRGNLHLMKLMILAAMLTSLSACAKKGSGSGARNTAPAKATQTNPPTPTSDADDNQSRTDSIEPVIVLDENGKPTDKKDTVIPGANGTNQPTGTPAQAGIQVGPKVAATTATPVTDAATTSSGGVIATGELADRLNVAQRYSGSADDALRNFLQYKLNSVSEHSLQLRNIRSAQAIQSASLKMALNQPSKQVEMRLILDGGSEAVFTGHIGNDLKAHLTSNFKGNLALATAQCMDKQPTASNQTGTCETVHVRIELGAKGSRSFVHIIFRRTAMKLAVSFPQDACSTQACDDLNQLFVTNQLNDKEIHNIEKHPNRFNEVKMESFEVINGRSGVKLRLATLSNELINISGDLLNSKIAAQVSPRASTEISMRDQHDTIRGINYKTNLNSKISDVHVIDNNGRGQVTLAITTRDNQRNVSDKIILQATRLSRELAMIIEQIKP